MTFDAMVEDHQMVAAPPSDARQRDARIIRVARDFSETPGGRAPRNGPFSGELFRETVLLPALREVPARHARVIVDLDGTDTYIGSFLEEAFGGLLRGAYGSYAELQDKLQLKATGEFGVFRDLAIQYMLDQDKINRR